MLADYPARTIAAAAAYCAEDLGLFAALVQDEPAEVDGFLIAGEAVAEHLVGAGTLPGMGYTSLVHGHLPKVLVHKWTERN